MAALVCIAVSLPERMMEVDPPRVSVIVPVRNEERSIARVVRQLAEQDYPTARFEVFIIDGCSTDGTRQIVEQLCRQYSNVRVLHNPKCWSSAARNIGVRASCGQYLVVVDGHCEIGSPSYLRALVATFERHEADCLGRPQPLEAAVPNLLQRAIGAARRSMLGHHPASYVYSSEELAVPAHSVAVAYRRSVFDQIGLFDERFDACEDVEFNHRIDRAGLRCVLAPELRVCYEPRASLTALFRQLMRYGRGRMRLLRKHPDTFSPVGFMPALFLAGCLTGSMTLLVSRWLAIAYLICLAIYICIVGLASLAVAWRMRQWALLPCLPVVFVTLHVAAGAGILGELIAGGLRLESEGSA
jgi:succinoglycan biosynthesis protein ExoA